jgi:hypothetical protein
MDAMNEFVAAPASGSAEFQRAAHGVLLLLAKPGVGLSKRATTVDEPGDILACGDDVGILAPIQLPETLVESILDSCPRGDN